MGSFSICSTKTGKSRKQTGDEVKCHSTQRCVTPLSTLHYLRQYDVVFQGLSPCANVANFIRSTLDLKAKLASMIRAGTWNLLVQQWVRLTNNSGQLHSITLLLDAPDKRHIDVTNVVALQDCATSSPVRPMTNSEAKRGIVIETILCSVHRFRLTVSRYRTKLLRIQIFIKVARVHAQRKWRVPHDIRRLQGIRTRLHFASKIEKEDQHQRKRKKRISSARIFQKHWTTKEQKNDEWILDEPKVGLSALASQIPSNTSPRTRQVALGRTTSCF